MDHLQEAWEVRLDDEGRVLASGAEALPGAQPGGGRYLVIPQDDGSLDLLALEVYAQRTESGNAAATTPTEAPAADPQLWGRRALGDLSLDPNAPLPLPSDTSSLTLVDPTQPDRPQPSALASSAPEANQSTLTGAVSEWTYWLTQNRDARNLFQQHQQGRPAGDAAAAARSSSARLPRSQRLATADPVAPAGAPATGSEPS